MGNGTQFADVGDFVTFFKTLDYYVFYCPVRKDVKVQQILLM